MGNRVSRVLGILAAILPNVAHAQYLAPPPAPPEEGKPAPKPAESKVLVYGSGDVQAPEAQFKDATAAGGLGVGYDGPLLRLTLTLRKGSASTVGATTDENGVPQVAETKVYGHTLLDPSVSDFNAIVDLGVYPLELTPDGLSPRLGVYFYAVTGALTWVYVDSAGELASVDTSAVGGGGCLSVLGRKRVRANSIGMWGHACASMRKAGGDLGNDGNRSVRQQILGTEQSTFWGPELIVGGQVGNLSLGLRMMYFFARDEGVDGLTDFRFIPYASASAPIEIPLD